jgi:hypothetical protein
MCVYCQQIGCGYPSTLTFRSREFMFSIAQIPFKSNNRTFAVV